MTDTPNWRGNGVRIVRSHELDTNTPQTPGITLAGANKLWTGTVNIHPDTNTCRPSCRIRRSM